MKKLFLMLTATIVLTGIIITGCKKKQIDIKDTNKAESISLQVSDFNYIVINGNKSKSVNYETLDWNNENLNVFYGFDNTKNAYVFYSEKDMIEWVKTTKRADEVLKVIKDIETAKQYANEIGEFENAETSEKFEEYMKENFATGESKAVGQFFHEEWYGGNSFLIAPWPKKSLKKKNDDKTCSLKFYGNAMRMYSEKNWKGSSRWIWTPTFIWLHSLGDFNNKLSSYWNW